MVQEEDSRIGKEAYLYELKDISYDGKEDDLGPGQMKWVTGRY